MVLAMRIVYMPVLPNRGGRRLMDEEVFANCRESGHNAWKINMRGNMLAIEFDHQLTPLSRLPLTLETSFHMPDVVYAFLNEPRTLIQYVSVI